MSIILSVRLFFCQKNKVLLKKVGLTFLKEFLSQDYRYYTSHSRRNEDDAENAGGFATSLTVYDLEGNLTTILENGRLLVAAAASRRVGCGCCVAAPASRA